MPQDPIDEARLLGYAYKTLQKTEGWTHEMLEQFKQIVITAEEKEVNIIAKQDYISDQKAESNSINKDVVNWADYYETLRIDNIKDTL